MVVFRVSSHLAPRFPLLYALLALLSLVLSLLFSPLISLITSHTVLSPLLSLSLSLSFFPSPFLHSLFSSPSPSSPLSLLLSPVSSLLYSDNAIAVKTKARNMSGDTIPHVRHKLHIVRCEAFLSGPPLLELSVDPWNRVRNGISELLYSLFLLTILYFIFYILYFIFCF